LVAEATDKELTLLVQLSGAVNDFEEAARTNRRLRDQMFLDFYERRAMTVTEMSRIAGIRRETVHEAINKARRQAA
jgi:hypothetical protein